MAKPIIIEVSLDDQGAVKSARRIKSALDTQFEGAVTSAADTGRRIGNALTSGLDAARRRLRQVGDDLKNAGTTLTAAVTAPIAGLVALAVKAAAENDKYEKTLTAITGSAERARAKIAELRDVAAKSPGVLTSSAVATFAQLRAIGDVTEQTINNVIRATGKLSTVFEVGNATDFNRNLTQIFQQGFERSDIKEAIGRVPIFEQLLEQAFGTKDSAKLKALKDAGKLTLDSFFAGIADAANNDPRLANIQESIGSQFEKLKDRLTQTLIPFGLEIIKVLSPIVTALVPVIEKVSAAFAALDPNLKTALVVFTGFLAILGPVVVALGALVAAISAIGGPVAIAIGAITALGAAITVAYAQNLGGIREKTQEVFQFISQFVRQTIGELLAWWNQNLPIFREALTNVLNAIRAFWQQHGEQITAIVQAYISNAIAIIKGVVRIIGDVIVLVAQLINGDWKGAWSTFTDIVQTVVSTTLTILRNLGTIIANVMKGVGAAILSGLKFVVTSSIEIGAQIIQGLVNGINAGAAFVFNTMKSLATGALNAAKSALGISSPSKEMQIIGEFVGEGFVIGLGKSQSSVEKAIRKLVGDNLKSAKDEIKTLTAEIGAMLAATPKQFQADAQIEQLNTMKESLRELAKLRKELGLSGLSKADLENFGVAGALAKAQIDKRINDTGGRSALALDLPNLENPLAGQQAATDALNDKVADLARTFQITRDAATNYERALQAINGELKGADQETKDQLLFFAKQKDAYELAQQQAEQARRNIQQITDVFNQAFRDGFEKGPKAFFARIFSAGKETFQRLAANALATLTTQILGGFLNRLGGLFGGSGAQGASGQGGGGLGGILGALFGGNRTSASGTGFGGFGGGTFGGSIFGGSNNSGGIGGIIKNLFGGGSSISAPASISAGGFLPPNIGLGTQKTLGLTNIASGLGGGGLLASLFKGIGFGKSAGSGGALASALPLLGLSLGSKVGGNSVLGQILGGAGGLAVGVGLTAAPAALSGTVLAGLFSNPFTAIAGVGLLVGGLLLGKAKQRKADEKLVDTYWVEYMNRTKALTDQVNGDQIEGAKALQEALAAREEAIALISQIKTKSVRDSRLQNQIPDVDRLFLEPLKAAIEAQKKRAVTIKNIIPEFATGGIVPGVDFGFDSVLAMLRPGEVILNQMQQARMKAQAGGDIFARAGVPGFGTPNSSQTRNGVAAYALGGIAEARPISPRNGAGAINLEVTLEIGEDDVTRLFVNGAETADGQKVVINTVKTGRKFREI